MTELTAKLGAPFAKGDIGAQEKGLRMVIVLLWLLWSGTMLIINDTTAGTSWPYDGSCYVRSQAFQTWH